MSERAPPMGPSPRRTSRWRHRFFQLAMVFKAIDGVLEVVGAVLLLAFGPAGVGGAARFLTQHELGEDPGDLLAGLLVRNTQDISVATVHFATVCVFFHGLVKIWLASSLIRDRRWVFPVALVLMALFVAYQLIRLHYQPSQGLVILTVLDVVIIVLVWFEYRALDPALADS
jgi:uncharacterized membrane protein